MAELLTGLIVCGACDAPLAPMVDGHGNQRRYVCATGKRPDCAIVCCPADQLDGLLTKLAVQRLEDAGLVHDGHVWRTATTDQRRELIASLVTFIILYPSRSNDPDKLDPAAVWITWKA